MTEYAFDNNEGAGDGDMDVAANWDPEGIPGSGDTAVIAATVLAGTLLADSAGMDGYTISGGTFVCPLTLTGSGNIIDGGSFKEVSGAGTGEIGGGQFDLTVETACNITGGTFDGQVTCSGSVSGGTFNVGLDAVDGGHITAGTYSVPVGIHNLATIDDGTFNEYVDVDGATIGGGTFNAYVNVMNAVQGGIVGGTFSATSTVYLDGSVTGTPVFNGSVQDHDGGPTIEGGTFNGPVNMSNGCYVLDGTFSATSRITAGFASIFGGTFAGLLDVVSADVLLEGGAISGRLRVFAPNWTASPSYSLDLDGSAIEVYAAGFALEEQDDGLVENFDGSAVRLMRREATFDGDFIGNGHYPAWSCDRAAGFAGPLRVGA